MTTRSTYLGAPLSAERSWRSARWPVLITALVVLSAVVAVSPLIDAETSLAPVGATLQYSVEYLLLSPMCAVYDMLTVLSVRQHCALLGALLLWYLVWRVLRWRHRGAGNGPWELGAFAVLLATFVGVYTVGLLLPRPMARLMLRDVDLIAVDFHSHTDASWDGRRGFDAEANRAWHRDAGFNAAYIADHKSIAGARAASAGNPRQAGDGTTLLEALEARDSDEHIIALNIDTTVDIDLKGQWHDPHISRALTHELRAPMLLLSIPGNVRQFPFLQHDRAAPIYAVELSDGSPKGLDQLQRDRARILFLADSLDLAVVAGSDNHGWGRTAVAWSVLRMPGWQRLTPFGLDSALQQTIRARRRHAVQVIARRTPDPGSSWVQLVASPVTIPWTMLRTLSGGERIAWVMWAWAIWGAIVLGEEYRRRPRID